MVAVTQSAKYSDVPDIERYLDPKDFHKVVPIDMYSDYIESVRTNDEDLLCPSLVITFRPEKVENSNNEIILPTALLNSQIAEVEVPLFLFEDSTKRDTLASKLYFQGPNFSDPRVLNMNQMIWLIIQNRLAYFKRRVSSNQKIYLDLLRNKDLSNLKSFIEYQKPVSFNAQKKIEHTYVILKNLLHSTSTNLVLGEKLTSNGFSEPEWQQVMRDLYPFIRPTSESSFHEKCKLVLSPNNTSIYRGPAFTFNGHSGIGTCIFPFKSNVIARLKTHIIGDGIELANPDKTAFKHDLKFINGHTTLLDNTTKLAVVVFHPMDLKSNRFVAGELEASESIAKELVVQQKHEYVTAESIDDILVKEGRTYYPNGQPFNLTKGTIIENGEVKDNFNTIYGIEHFTVKYIKIEGTSTFRITFTKTMKAGNARLTSKTGLKGVTNIVGKDRHVYIAPEGQTIDDIQDHPTRETILTMRSRKLKDSHPQYDFLTSVNGELEQINSVPYKTINPSKLLNWKKVKVDIVTGMNAVKAKTNTIKLAQALMAVEMGYYKPIPKGKDGIYTGILDASDEIEINKASESLPDMVYLDENNIPNKCYIGLVPINFTELGKTFVKFKPQSFSFESGNVIKSVYPPLFNYIFSNYLEEDKKNVCLELYEILNDTSCKLALSKNIPIFNLHDIRSNIKAYDLIVTGSSRDIIDSILFNEDFNPNGFIIDVRRIAKNTKSTLKTRLVRIPSASTLKYFMSKREDGTYMYDPFLSTISRILMPLIGYRNINSLTEDIDKINDISRIPFYYLFSDSSRPLDQQPQNSISFYFTMLQGIVYSSSDSSKQLTQSLIKPRIPGFSLKQVVSSLIPDDVVVQLDPHIHKRTNYTAGKDQYLDPNSDEYQIIDLAIEASNNKERLEIKEDLLRVLDNVALVILNRNPFLTI